MGQSAFTLIVGWHKARSLMKLEKVLQDGATAVGKNTFRMKLHPPDRESFVPNTHYFPFLRLRRDFQKIRHGIPLDNQGVITRGIERIGHASEQIFAVVFNGRSFPVHHAVIYNHIRAKRVPDALMSQANAKNRNFARELPNDVV